jgi:hypothetical protein
MKNMNLPTLVGKEKSELLELLLQEEYGHLPPKPQSMRVDVISTDEKFCAGKAILQKLALTCDAPLGEFTFPFYFVCPKSEGTHPAFIHINFRDDIPDRYQPTEEIIDRGFAVLTVYYKDVSSDDGDFTNGLAGKVYENGKRPPNGCGKIGLWAFAAMRVMDYAQTLPQLDHGKISVVGHSRLGKTALLTGALDERFFCAFSNDSGCSGAALARGNDGETVEKICNRFPFWFCENYYKYKNNEGAMPFDQHYLIAANYPHRVYVASAEGDLWACPKNEFLACVAADGFFTERGCATLGATDMPPIGTRLHRGHIGYHSRPGLHYLSREDWNAYCDYLLQHFKA